MPVVGNAGPGAVGSLGLRLITSLDLITRGSEMGQAKREKVNPDDLHSKLFFFFVITGEGL